MKKFLRMLNDFLHVKEYEYRVKERNRIIKYELKYCQDLLLLANAEKDDRVGLSPNIKISDVQIYIRDIVERRKEENERYDRWKRSLKETGRKA